VQRSDERHDHDSPRLRLALAAVLTALAAAAPAGAAHYAALPSPLAPLSPAPPLGGGALSSTEGVRHRVDSTIDVRVSIGPDGTPFRIVAAQTLSVRVQGDYFFAIGAPLLAVTALPGSDSTPGQRSTQIVWAGFNPRHRTLKARAVIDPAQAAASLPVRIETHGEVTTFVNTTGTTVAAYTADAEPAPLLRYLDRLRLALAQDVLPEAGGALLTGPSRPTRVHVVVPLVVRGTVGGLRVSRLVTGRLDVHARGPVEVTVSAQLPTVGDVRRLSGRELLALATKDVLTVARVHQYRAFLGNPDPTGRSSTLYTFRTAARPLPPVAAVPVSHGRDWTTTVAVLAGLLVAAGAGIAVWARA
jgi:hypothetical protein